MLAGAFSGSLLLLGALSGRLLFSVTFFRLRDRWSGRRGRSRGAGRGGCFLWLHISNFKGTKKRLAPLCIGVNRDFAILQKVNSKFTFLGCFVPALGLTFKEFVSRCRELVYIELQVSERKAGELAPVVVLVAVPVLVGALFGGRCIV